ELPAGEARIGAALDRTEGREAAYERQRLFNGAIGDRDRRRLLAQERQHDAARCPTCAHDQHAPAADRVAQPVLNIADETGTVGVGGENGWIVELEGVDWAGLGGAPGACGAGW